MTFVANYHFPSNLRLFNIKENKKKNKRIKKKN